MLPEVGYSAVLLSLFLALYAAVAAYFGARRGRWAWIESARNALLLILPLLFLASSLLVALLLLNDFSVEYVWRVTSRETPTYLKVSALWGSQAGSLLFWNLLLSSFVALAMWRKWRDDRELMPYAILMSALIQLFFLSLTAGFENPFARFDFTPQDGNGLNPLLRHPGMIIHPPMLYLGFVGFIVPYAFAMAALVSGRLDDTWIRTTRRWTLLAWMFLSIGLVLGGRWAYDVLGWGGYWAWDPVENASFMPWLAATAFLHSAVIQEKQGMFKVWNMFLIILTFLLVIYGTFIVRTGIISSVHSFAQSSIGYYFFAFVAAIILFSFVVLYARRGELAADNRLNSLLSRESAFLLNNFLIVGILFATFWGTNYPIISELVIGEQVTVGEPFYEKVNGPLFAALLLLMGVAPLTMWYRTSLNRLGRQMIWPAGVATVIIAAAFILGLRHWIALLGFWIVVFSLSLTLLEFWKGTRARMRGSRGRAGEPFFTALGRLINRNRRRYGGYVIHLGVLIMGFGVIGSELFQQERQIFLNAGESASLGAYRVVFNGTRSFEAPDGLVILQADLDLFYNNRRVGNLTPYNEIYTRTGQTMTIPDLRSTVGEDFYLRLIDWEGITATSATFRLYLNPLINWVWAGGLILVFGSLVAMWPDAAGERALAARQARVTRLSPAD